jgi:flagellar M-ring protein FliF
MKKILASLTLRQRITIAIVALVAGSGLYSLVHWKREADFRPLVTGLAAEDAAGVVQKLKESGVEYRLPEGGGAVLVPIATPCGDAAYSGRGRAAENRADRIRALR